MNNWKQTLLPFFLLFTSALLDGFVTSGFSSHLNTPIGLITPRLVVLVLIVLSFHYNQNFMYFNAALIGFIMDAYYIGFLGVYMASFILVVNIVSGLKEILEPNVLTYALASILGLTACETLVYGIMRILGVTSMSFQVFLVSRLSATLLFNVLVMFIISYFLHLIIVNFQDEIEFR